MHVHVECTLQDQLEAERMEEILRKFKTGEFEIGACVRLNLVHCALNCIHGSNLISRIITGEIPAYQPKKDAEPKEKKKGKRTTQ
jgi:hypothetical protein